MFNDYTVPENHIFLENELVNIETDINPLLENFTEKVTEAGIEGFINILINGLVTSKVTSIGQIVGIALAAIPFLNTIIVKNKAKAGTIIKANGFSLGLIGGISLAYIPYATRNKFSVKKSIIKSLAKSGLRHTIKSNPRLNMMIYMIINKAATKILKMPEHSDLLGDFLKNPDVLFNPKEILKSYLFSLLSGFIIGLFVFKSTFKLIFKNAKTESLLEVFSTSLKGEFRTISIGVATNNFNGIISGLKSVKMQKPKPDKKYLNLYHDYVQTNKYLATEHKFTSGVDVAKISTKDLKMRKYHADVVPQNQMQILEHTETTIEQAIAVLRDNVDTQVFDNSIDSITLLLSDGDSAFITRSKRNRTKFTIFIVMNRNISKSVWSTFTVREVAAVLAHEFGHFYGGAFTLLPAVKLTYLAIVLAEYLVSSEQIFRMLVEAGAAYSIVSFAKLAEIQADAYAIKCGFGKELHSSLNKMVRTTPLIDEFGALTTHGSNGDRLSGILKWSKLYPKLEKQAKS